MLYNFHWDPRKAASNVSKHGVTFQQAATVFKDPTALSIYDTEHGRGEDRWMTLGLCATGILLVVHHTFVEDNPDFVAIRIFSARKATKHEQLQYAE